jgi:glycosyltransferase involved in cell wall biosynthesis
MTKRILLIIPTLDRCGAEKQLTLLACGLPRDRFDVHVCVLTRDGPLRAALDQAGIAVTLIGKSWKIDPVAYWRLYRTIRRLQPDLVHTWLFAANAYGRQAARQAGVPHVLAGERCVDPWKRWHELAIDRYLARRTERLVTNSQGVVEFYRRQGLPASKFVVIPNAVQPAGPSPITRGQLLAELELPPETRLIGAVNRLWPQKRVKDLIWAADLLKVARDDAHLLIIGDGPQRWRLQRYRDQVEIGDRVHFLGERSDVSQLMPHFDCLWLGSQYEGQSNAVLEAMAAGVPVVATDIAGNRELVVHGQTGFLVPVGDRAGFARWTHRLLEDADLAHRCGSAAAERVRDEFSVEKMIQRHIALYEELLGQSAPSKEVRGNSFLDI